MSIPTKDKVMESQYHGQKNYRSKIHEKVFFEAIKHLNFKGTTVLDVGAGNGWCGKEFKRRNAKKVILTDIMPLNKEILKMDMTQLKFKDETFDFVNCHGSLHHVKHPTRALKELSRVLKPQGILILTGEAILEGSWIKTHFNRYFQYIYLRFNNPEEWKAGGRNYLANEYVSWCASANLKKIKEGIYKKNE
ncbi:hypothetical protein COV13_00185 [Candidatus Woesearchaeota archaeon CG10_big_fil_rev_8_21_14_0_10_32_9]|nr:MAG: hypothetical protein COV13_00185 [Candidatus Woesearchaeota archaeon CG10_big_fil_rev_8_21_14_0_10_32_9]